MRPDRRILAAFLASVVAAGLLVAAPALANWARRHESRHNLGTWALAWDDLRFPASRIRQGATQKPDFDATNLGLLFPQNDATEIAYLIVQLPHAWKYESDLHPHLHYVQDEASNPTWKLDYRWYETGGDPTGGFTTITASVFAVSYSSGSILQVASFPAIDATGIDTLSSMLDIKLYRDDNVVTGDVLVKEFDIHLQLDSPGSPQEFTK